MSKVYWKNNERMDVTLTVSSERSVEVLARQILKLEDVERVDAEESRRQ